MGKTYGAPFVKLYNSNDEVIDSFERVSRFKYTDSVKINDSSSITLSSSVVDLVDDPNLMPGRKIKFIFGYTGGIVSDKIELYIFDRSPNMGSDGVTLSLELYPKAAYMSLNSGDDVRSDFSAIDLSQELSTKYGLVLESDVQGDRVWENLDELDSHVDDLSLDQVKDLEFKAKITSEQETNASLALERSASNRFIPSGVPAKSPTINNKVDYTIKKFQSKAQGKKSDAQELQDVLNLQEGGPWLASGKGDKLLIVKRDFTKVPVKSYHWKRGEGRVQGFSPTENNKQLSKKASSLRVNSWDDETKRFQQLISSPLDGSAVLLSNNIQTDFKSESELDESLLKLSKPEINKLELEADPVNYVDKSVVVNTPSGVGLADVDTLPDTIRTKFNYKARAHDTIDSIENNAGDSVIQADNKRREDTLELNSAGLDIIGEPNITSNNLIQVIGVGKLYSGKWFIDSVTHTLNNSGAYLTSLSLVRNSKGKTDNNKEDHAINGEDIGLPKNNATVRDTLNTQEDAQRTIE
jgi:hypothetical protein